MNRILVINLLILILLIIVSCGKGAKSDDAQNVTKNDSKDLIMDDNISITSDSIVDTNSIVKSSSEDGSLKLQKDIYTPNEEMIITFVATNEVADNAWIGVIPSGVEHGSNQNNDDNDIDFDFLANEISGSIYLLAPSITGKYDLRMSDPDLGKEITSISFEVK